MLNKWHIEGHGLLRIGGVDDHALHCPVVVGHSGFLREVRIVAVFRLREALTDNALGLRRADEGLLLRDAHIGRERAGQPRSVALWINDDLHGRILKRQAAVLLLKSIVGIAHVVRFPVDAEELGACGQADQRSDAVEGRNGILIGFNFSLIVFSDQRRDKTLITVGKQRLAAVHLLNVVLCELYGVVVLLFCRLRRALGFQMMLRKCPAASAQHQKDTQRQCRYALFLYFPHWLHLISRPCRPA